jgi:NADH-quinone oxidoreductase subunit E
MWSNNVLSEAEQQELNQVLKKYPDKQSAVLPALYIAQRRRNYLTDDDIRDVAQALDVNVTEVQSVVGFYTLLRKEPTGKYLIQVCTDLPCALRGVEEFYRRLCQRLGLPLEGGSTDDGLFTVEKVVCLAACDKTPVAQINLEYYENLTDEMIDALIAGLRKQNAEDSKGGEYKRL